MAEVAQTLRLAQVGVETVETVEAGCNTLIGNE